MWFISGYIIGMLTMLFAMGLGKAAGEYDDSMGYNTLEAQAKALQEMEEKKQRKKAEKAKRRAEKKSKRS